MRSPGDRSDELEMESAEESQAPPFHFPYVTFGILALIGVIFLAMFAAGHGDVGAVAQLFGAKDNTLIRQGQYWRFITPVFLHGGFPHLLVNSYSLYQLGRSMERIYGSRKYLLIFLFAGITGNLLSFALSRTPSLGASGALFGLVGAGLIFPLRFHALIPAEARSSIVRQLAVVAIFNLALGFWLQGIVDNWAHIGGLLGGAFLALFLIPDVLQGEPSSPLASAVLNFLTLVGIGAVITSWALQWQWARQSGPQMMISYSPSSEVAWWSISVPARWRFKDGVWRGPEGETLRIRESLLTDPTIAPLLLPAPHTTTFHTELDGKSGWYTTRPNRIDYVIPIPAYNRVLELALESTQKPLAPRAKSDFALITASLRFIRPPYVFHAPIATP